MTNREWFVEAVKTMNTEGLSNMLGCPCDRICNDNDGMCDGDCREAWIKWFDKERIKPMPELKVGMFVNVRHTFGDYGIGVVTQDTVVYENGGFDWISQIKNDVIAIYQANCFDGCNDNNIIWEES